MPSVCFARANVGAGITIGSPTTSGTYADPHAGGAAVPFESWTWTADRVTTPFAFDELIASWNATTPEGTWVRIEMSAGGAGRAETKWYTLGIWASGDATVRRTSVPLQGDGDGSVEADVFVRAKQAAPLTGYTLRVILYRTARSALTPTVTLLGAMVSAASPVSRPAFVGSPADINVPQLSQETHVGHFPQYDNGGEAWCSPTSTAMVLRHWEKQPATELLAFPGDHSDGDVDHAARQVYDHGYEGTGNWPFNTAYAASRGLSGFVTRLRSLNEAELFIAKGIPLIASVNGKLPGFLLDQINGHLLVIRGLAAGGEVAAYGGAAEPGDVITNDPAVWQNHEARKIYRRADFENVWLGGSQGIVYVIWDPATTTLPTSVAGADPNW